MPKYFIPTMKIPFLALVVFLNLTSVIVSAQIKGKLVYTLTVNDGKLGRRIETKTMFFNSSSSIEFPAKKRQEDFDNSDESIGYIVKTNKNPDFIYKSFSKKSLNFRGLVGGKGHLVTDTLSNFSWKITKEKSKISNFNCIKATTTFRGRNYVAWYSEDIPLQNGPWKFCGLPGLIIKIADDREVFSYLLTGIDLKAKFDNAILSLPTEYNKEKAISYHEYVNLYKKKAEAYAKLSKVVQTGANGGTGTVVITLSEEMEKTLK